MAGGLGRCVTTVVIGVATVVIGVVGGKLLVLTAVRHSYGMIVQEGDAWQL